jgi:hypothetical protein
MRKRNSHDLRRERNCHKFNNFFVYTFPFLQFLHVARESVITISPACAREPFRSNSRIEGEVSRQTAEFIRQYNNLLVSCIIIGRFVYVKVFSSWHSPGLGHLTRTV